MSMDGWTMMQQCFPKYSKMNAMKNSDLYKNKSKKPYKNYFKFLIFILLYNIIYAFVNIKKIKDALERKKYK